MPEYDGAWTPAALGKARLVARLRERGYTLAQIRRATEEGRLAFGRILELFEVGGATYTRTQARRRTGLDADTVDPVAARLGIGADQLLDEVALQVLSYVAAAIAAGLPREAMQQLTRVYAQAISQIADAEVRLVHLYVHEPLMRSGGSADEMASAMLSVAEGLLPLSTPLLEQLHRRMLMHFIDQDVVGHMETELAADEDDVGRMRVAIAFADLAGYTQLTEREGDLHALDVVDRFVGNVIATLPDDARVIKTIGDEVMVVGPDPAALAGWAVRLGALMSEHPRPRAAVHYGYAQYREGDYFGREVNLAARVQAQSGAGEVLVTRPVVEASGPGLRFEPLAEVRLRGLQRADRAVPGARRGARVSVVETILASRPGRGPAGRGPARGRDALGRTRLDLPARRGRQGRRRGGGDRAACQLRPARRRRRGRAPLPRALRASRSRADRDAPGAPTLGNLQAWARERATAPPRCSRFRARRTSRRDTPPPTRSRRSSTGWRPRRAAGRCSACVRATAT